MMKSLFYKMKRSKSVFAIMICFFVCLVLDFALLVFDMIEFVVIKSNSAKLAGMFLGLNIFVIALNILTIAFIVVVLILKKMEKIR